MSPSNLDFEVTDTGMDGGKFKITIVPKGDYRFFGLVFNFHNVVMNFADDGVGVTYDLNVDFASNQVPDTVTPERQKDIQDFGEQLLGKFVEDTLDAIHAVLDRPMQEQYTMKGCSESCTGECHESI